MKKKKATKAQRERINNMLASGLINREDAQAIIERLASLLRRRKRENNGAILRSWVDRFPEHGVSIYQVLKPFYDWDPGLGPELPDLVERAKEAVWWCTVRNVRVFRDEHEVDRVNCLRIDTILNDAFGDLLCKGLPKLQEDFQNFFPEKSDDLKELYGEAFFNSLEYAVWLRLDDRLDDRFGRQIKLDALLELWHAGNLPIGLDSQDNLLVLVAG